MFDSLALPRAIHEAIYMVISFSNYTTSARHAEGQSLSYSNSNFLTSFLATRCQVVELHPLETLECMSFSVLDHVQVVPRTYESSCTLESSCHYNVLRQ